MEARLDPALLSEVRKYGRFDVEACYNCGSCAAVCALSTDGAMFPRKSMRYVQLGLKQPLHGSLDPWLCYYCGDCAATCPRQTEPGESMMTLRRYLMAVYDWTGFSSKFYRSKPWQLGALALTGALVLVLGANIPGGLVDDFLRDPGASELMHFGHLAELTLITAVGLFVLSPNMFRMYWFAMHSDTDFNLLKVPSALLRDGFGYVRREDKKIRLSLGSFLKEIVTPLLHGAFQLKFLDCTAPANARAAAAAKHGAPQTARSRWIRHWLMASGYVLMLTMIIFLGWFKTLNYPLWHPVRFLGYYATIILVIFTIDALIGRIRQREQSHKFSELSDWLFSIWLFLMAASALTVYIAMSLKLGRALFYAYVFHLMVLVQWAVIIVPFGKWIHFMYRPLAIFLQSVRERALKECADRVSP